MIIAKNLFMTTSNKRNTFEINNLLQKLIKNFYPDSKLFYDKPIENHGEKPMLIEVNDRNDQKSCCSSN